MVQKGPTDKRSLPNNNRLSILSALIILAYLLTHFINFPEQILSLQLPGVFLSVKIDANIIVAFLVAGLAAMGADWLLYDHPNLQARPILPHCLLPSLTALIIGIPLYQLPFNLTWWMALLSGSLLLILVLIAEYVSVSEEALFRQLASAGLTAVSLALYLILAAGLRSIGTRLFLLLPALAIGASLVSFRVLHLRLHRQWLFYEALFIAFISAQITAALYYWPLNPVSFGLLNLGVLYSLISLLAGLIDEKPLQQIWLEPAVVIVIVLGATYWANF